MKKDKEKRKNHESKIGKMIYGFLLFMPLFAIGVTCLTTFWNKTIEMPTQEVISTSEYETNEVYSVNDLIPGNIYEFTYQINYVDTRITYFNASEMWFIKTRWTDADIIDIKDTTGDITLNETDPFFVVSIGNQNINTRGNKSDYVNTKCYFVYYDNFNADYISQVGKANWMPTSDYEIIETESTDLNVFYYSVDKVEQSDLFNWAKTSMIYTGILNFTTAMNVTNTFMPMLLTYWLIISVIYFLYDIVLIILVVLHRKIHELQESI